MLQRLPAVGQCDVKRTIQGYFTIDWANPRQLWLIIDISQKRQCVQEILLLLWLDCVAISNLEVFLFNHILQVKLLVLQFADAVIVGRNYFLHLFCF